MDDADADAEFARRTTREILEQNRLILEQNARLLERIGSPATTISGTVEDHLKPGAVRFEKAR